MHLPCMLRGEELLEDALARVDDPRHVVSAHHWGRRKGPLQCLASLHNSFVALSRMALSLLLELNVCYAFVATMAIKAPRADVRLFGGLGAFWMFSRSQAPFQSRLLSSLRHKPPPGSCASPSEPLWFAVRRHATVDCAENAPSRCCWCAPEGRC